MAGQIAVPASRAKHAQQRVPERVRDSAAAGRFRKSAKIFLRKGKNACTLPRAC